MAWVSVRRDGRGVAVVTIDNRLKGATIDGFNKLAENARRKGHAPFLFLSLDNQKINE